MRQATARDPALLLFLAGLRLQNAWASFCVPCGLPFIGGRARPSLDRRHWGTPNSDAQQFDDAGKDVNAMDWRAFRAQLLQTEQKHHLEGEDGEQFFLAGDYQCSQLNRKKGWIFEQTVIEEGSVLVHHPDPGTKQQELKGLQRQFLHKAIVLVIERTLTHTIGLVLNRPTDLTLRDDILAARISYGGDLFSIHDNGDVIPKFYCLYKPLHSMNNDNEFVQTGVQSKLMLSGGLYFTSITDAHDMVRDGYAMSEEFTVYCGFVAWPTAELEFELSQGQWHSITLDAGALYRILRQKSPWKSTLASIDEKHAERFGSDDEIETFNDRMLQEWSRQKLVFGDESPSFLRSGEEAPEKANLHFSAGDILYAADCSHYLLESQEYHQAIMLVLQDDDELSVACLLNHPTVDDCVVNVPIRYGGSFGDVQDDNNDEYVIPLFVLHRLSQIGGEPVGHYHQIWKASTRTAQQAIDSGVAVFSDFLIIQGMQVWPKDESGLNFLHREYAEGRWRRVPSSQPLDRMWQALGEQVPARSDTLDTNVNLAQKAWREAHGQDDVGDKTSIMGELSTQVMRTWAGKSFLSGGLRP